MNLYFVKLADTSSDEFDDISGYDDDYTLPFDLSAGIEYRPWKFLSVSIGYQFMYTSGSPKTYNDLEYSLDCHALGGGIRFTPWEFVSLTIGGQYVIFHKGKDITGVETYHKKIAAFAVGAEYRFLTGSDASGMGMDLKRRKRRR